MKNLEIIEEQSVELVCSVKYTVAYQAVIKAREEDNILASLLDNHKELIALWEDAIPTNRDTKMKEGMIGAQSTMTSFRFCLVVFSVKESCYKQTT